jgi:transposase
MRLRLTGQRVNEISEFLGVHRNTVSTWWQYEHHSESACYQHLRGRVVGAGRILRPGDEAEAKAAMVEQFPAADGMDSALWTRHAVQVLIEQLWGPWVCADGSHA